jgi:hypothetical protein
MSKDKKLKALAEIVKKRQKTKMMGEYINYKNISYASPRFDSDKHGFKYCVTPITKGACNVESKVMLVLNNWISVDEVDNINKEDKIDRLVEIGYKDWGATASTNTKLNKNIIEGHLNKRREDVYITNVFPFIKSGSMIGKIHSSALDRAMGFFEEQLSIVNPKVLFVLGKHTENAFCDYFYNNKSYVVSNKTKSGCSISNKTLLCAVFFMKHPSAYSPSEWKAFLNVNRTTISLI